MNGHHGLLLCALPEKHVIASGSDMNGRTWQPFDMFAFDWLDCQRGTGEQLLRKKLLHEELPSLICLSCMIPNETC